MAEAQGKTQTQKKPRSSADRGMFPWPGIKNVWGIGWTEGGKERKRKIGNKEQARTALLNVHSRLLQSDGMLPVERRKTLLADAIRDHIASIQATSRDLRKQEYFARMWSEHFDGRKLSQVTSKDLSEWKAARLQAGAKPATINRALSFLRRIYSKAMDQGEVTTNPVKQTKLLAENNARDRFLTPEEQVILLVDLWPTKYRVHILLLLATGMRLSEMLNLRWQDVDWNQRQIIIPRSKHGEKRRIPLNDEAMSLLRTWQAANQNPMWVVPNKENDGPMSTFGGLRAAFDRAIERCGLQNLHLHDLRHTFASRLVMAGVDLYTVQRLLGHKTIHMTQRYAHLAPDYLQEAVNKLPRIPLPESLPEAGPDQELT